MSPVSTSLAYPLVQFSFSAPATNGKPITGYQIAIYSPLSKQFIVTSSVCDGASAQVIADMNCKV